MSDSRNAEKFVVRLPKGMRELIASASRSNRRSMNSEIVAVLERHYDPQCSTEEFKLDGNTPQDEFWSPRIGALVEHPGGIGVVAEFFMQRGQVFVELEVLLHNGRSRATLPLASVRPVHHRVSKDFT